MLQAWQYPLLKLKRLLAQRLVPAVAPAPAPVPMQVTACTSAPPAAGAPSSAGATSLFNGQSGQLVRLLDDAPKLLAMTADVPGNREVDLHPCLGTLAHPHQCPSVRGLSGIRGPHSQFRWEREMADTYLNQSIQA